MCNVEMPRLEQEERHPGSIQEAALDSSGGGLEVAGDAIVVCVTVSNPGSSPSFYL